MDSCIFCKIANKEIGSEIIYETGEVLAMLDIHPRAPGHTMVILKAHRKTILDLAGAEVTSVFSGVQKVTEILQQALAPDGFTIGINQGAASGQVVEHLHIHIIPRFENDGGSSIHAVVDNQSGTSLEEVVARIKNEDKISKS